MTEQTTFGKVEVTELTEKPSTRPKCDFTRKDYECENRAIIMLNNRYESGFFFRCSIHSKEWWLDEIDYD